MKHRFRNHILLLFVLILATPVVACAGKSEPAIQWSKTSDWVSFNPSVQQTTDGGYLICGYTLYEIWLIKTDVNGDKLWDKLFGDADRRMSGHSIQQTTDGGYVICGSSKYSSNLSDEDVLLIKADAEGNELWGKTFGEKKTSEIGNSVQQTTDGGYIICGDIESIVDIGSGRRDHKIWLIKTDAGGNKLWDKVLSSSNWDAGSSVQQTTDGGYILCGSTYSSGNEDVWLIKADAEGNKLWEKVFGDDYRYEWGKLVQQTTDGGYMICADTGYHRDTGGYLTDEAVLLVKTDTDGNELWHRIFDGISDSTA